MEADESVPDFSLGMLFMWICYLGIPILTNALKHCSDGPVWHSQGPLNNLTCSTVQFCSVSPCNSIFSPAYFCMAAKIACRLPIWSIKVPPDMSPAHALALTCLHIALEDMNTSSWVSYIINRWDGMEECVDWCVPILCKVICINIKINTFLIDSLYRIVPRSASSVSSDDSSLTLITDTALAAFLTGKSSLPSEDSIIHDTFEGLTLQGRWPSSCTSSTSTERLGVLATDIVGIEPCVLAASMVTGYNGRTATGESELF